ncbi:MAG: hypothetical protein ACJ8AX_05305, partial [Gemmatimonadales bacterium]
MSLPLQHPVIRGNGRGRHAPAPDVGWRERLQALRHLPKLLRMVWETEPRYVVGILLLRVARSAVPLAVLWIGKLIVDGVVHAINLHNAGDPIPWSRLGLLIGIELAIALVGEGLSRVSALLESLLGDLFANRTSVQLMQHAATLDLEQFENAEIYDKLERARRQTVGRIGLFTMLLATLQDLITLVSLSVALAVYVPWLLVLLVVAVLPSLLGETHFASLGYSLLFSWTPERRTLDYLRYIGASDISAKELKLFGLSDFLVGRYDRLSQEFYEANKALSVRRSIVSTLLSIVGTLGYYAAYAVIIYLTVVGHRSAAGLFTLLLSTVQDAITFATLAAALAVYVPWLLVLLLVAVLPSLLGETHFASLGYSLLYSWTPERRQLDYLRFVGASDRSAKEVQMFGLAPWLT